MKILVFGKTGQVATELARRCPACVGMECLGREEADLSDPAACADAITASGADVVINAAAYTKVDLAEEDEVLATVVNGAAPTRMAAAAAAKGVPFVHVSTDYVFDGSGTVPWTPDAATGPLGAYGRSKLAGETGVRGAGGAHVILRTSWVFSAHGANFVKSMLRLAGTNDRLKIVADQIGGPTAALDIADALLAVAAALAEDHGKSGVYHFAGAPDVSWADFAREIFAQSGSGVDVTNISGSEFPTKAVRPMNSRLDCTGFTEVFEVAKPDWRISLGRVLAELGVT